MSLTERERLTQARYDASAEDWIAHSGGRNRACFWLEEMAEFTDRLDGNKRVLEVGCGPATDGMYLERSGVNVLSTDYSGTMLSIAKELNPQRSFVKMDMQDLCFPNDSFDGFWATACLLHLENPDKAVKELARVTKKGGVGFISIKEGAQDVIDVKTGYYFHYYNNLEFIEKLSSFGLTTIQSGRKAGTPNHDYLTYLVRVKKPV